MKTKLLVVLAIVLSAVALGLSIANLAKDDNNNPVVSSSVTSQINPNQFQAIFLPNDQVYFGHLTILDAGHYKLTDVYYMADSNDTSKITKLGQEAHKPEDKMVIPVGQVQFWENLKDAGQFNGQLR